MARRFTKVSEVEIVAINETAYFYPSDLVNTKTTIPLRIGQLVGNYLSGVDTGFFLIRGGAPQRNDFNLVACFFLFCRILLVLESDTSSHEGWGARTPPLDLPLLVFFISVATSAVEPQPDMHISWTVVLLCILCYFTYFMYFVLFYVHVLNKREHYDIFDSQKF